VVKNHHQKSRQVQVGMKMELERIMKMERMGQMGTETMPKGMEVLCHHLDRLVAIR
jgi:methylthioribose-1-phosphate isomerase